MSVVRVNKTKNYTVMSNYHLRDKNMSLKAIGLLSKMLSLPDDWDYSVAGLVSICVESKTAIQNILKELEGLRYLKRTRVQNSKGQFEYIYDIFEKPYEDLPRTGNLCTGNQCTGNQPQLNTKSLNTKSLNTKNNIYDETKVPSQKENSKYEEFFEEIWGSLKPNKNDRKDKVSMSRKKELYKMGAERVKKAIKVYLATQDEKYMHKRDNILNFVIDNYIDKEISDFKRFREPDKLSELYRPDKEYTDGFDLCDRR